MYDREGRFKMEDTMNAARIEYTEKAVMNMAARRCDVVKISQSEAVLALMTQYNLPGQFYLDIPDARINKIGCVLMKVELARHGAHSSPATRESTGRNTA